MVQKNVSKWGIMVPHFLDVTDTMAITLLEWQKTSKLNVYTKSQWPYCEYEVISRIFGKIKNENWFTCDIGSYYLHIVYVSFKTGTKKSE